MLTELVRNRTLFLFWLFAFGVMLIADTVAIIVFCYLAKQFGEEWVDTVERSRRRKQRDESNGCL